ncbi:heterokaryon incompatibility protein-domain-containing protein [Pyrenochaeta sp. MPI-SDFR-AT-0127]|nr:heterokaryon incompatibility protein-domain-containing protein [Pyrenochaeta sp. MPI-SDFR-AT-0127]
MEAGSPKSSFRSIYETLPTDTSIRVLEVNPATADEHTPLSCTLYVTDLKSACLEYNALSYTWGDPLFRYWYEKRSVTWAQDVTIFCNDMRVKITSNLNAALRATSRRQAENIRAQNHTRYLWVDSLCINQEDTQERNTQVNLMAQIYSKASLVISWLGPADKDSDAAIPLIRQLFCMMKSPAFEHIHRNQDLKGMSAYATKENLSIPNAGYGSVARFFARQYFFRCWVIQEIILALNLRILCGSEELAFEELMMVAEFVTNVQKYRLNEAIGQAFTLSIKANRGFGVEAVLSKLFLRDRRMVQSQTTFTLGDLLLLTRTSGCSDPRDKVYAVLGMASKGGFGITPDYNKSTADVYNDAIRHQILDKRNLDVLSWVTDKSRRRFPQFPSWIGEFDVVADIRQQELAYTTTTHRATGASESPQVEPLVPEMCVLSLRGKEIDRVVELSEAWAWHGLGVGYDPLWTSMTLKLPHLYPTGQTRGEALIHTFVADEINDAEIDKIVDIDAFKAIVRRDTCFALIRYLHRLYWFSGLESPTKGYEAAASSVLCDLETLAASDTSGYIPALDDVRGMEPVTCACNAHLSDYSDDNIFIRPEDPDLSCPYVTELQRDTDFKPGTPSAIPHAPNVPDAQDWDSRFSGAMNNKMYLRRVARTGNGYLGLVPDSSRVGDAVWLLQGAKVPFILRRAEGNKSQKRTNGGDSGSGDCEEDGGQWEVMGESYVHGVMQGEVWNRIKEEELVDVQLV